MDAGCGDGKVGWEGKIRESLGECVLNIMILRFRFGKTSIRFLGVPAERCRPCNQTEQEQHIKNIRVALANQLKSGDLSVKTTNVEEAEALKQFADDRSGRIGNGTSIRVPAYGIIAHGTRTRSMDMTNFEEAKGEMLQDNKPFIPLADIK
ncbi:hypothetical protein B0J14DRAFT_571476 [Halenospora varia]|nr:hypothetical protein B0J14DRAFT_571476 [Halenospora varia]